MINICKKGHYEKVDIFVIIAVTFFTGEYLKMMQGAHSSWQEAMPRTLLLFLLHGLSLSFQQV